MKNKKGFTLIELLAVIVILALLALILTPIMMGVIEDSKRSAAERSVENYVEFAETGIMRAKLKGVTIVDGEYKVDADGNLCPSGLTCNSSNKIIMEVSGNKPAEGSTIQIKDEKVQRNNISITIDDYRMVFDKTTNTYISYSTTKQICTLLQDSGKAGISYGDRYQCDPGDGKIREFYVLEYLLEDGNTATNTKLTKGVNGTTNKGEITLIANENVKDFKPVNITKEDYLAAGGTEEDWNNGIRNNFGPVTALKELRKKLVDWTDVEINIPFAEQLVQTSSYYYGTAAGYFDNAGKWPNATFLPTYLSENLVSNDQDYRYAYKTATVTHKWDGKETTDRFWTYAYGKGSNGTQAVFAAYQEHYNSWGVRPVITISKSNIY